MSQSQQTAKLLRPFRQPLLTNTDDGGAVMGHGRHAELYDSALRPFVANLSGPSAEQTGKVSFHHRTAIATGTRPLDLIRGPFTVQARLIQEVEHLLGVGWGWMGWVVCGMPIVRIPRSCST